MSLILDNGGYTIKGGFSKSSPLLIPNCITRTKAERRRNFIGMQLEECKDLSSLYYMLPFQRGYLMNWDTQRQIWDYIFGSEVLKVKPADTNLIFTEPMFNFSSIQEALNEIFFEEYNFKSMMRATAPALAAYEYCNYIQKNPCCVVVDSGYSFTHVVPFYKGKAILEAVLRIDIGGKVLTNHLKEITSYRQLHVLDETYVINQVKEDVCYVAMDLYKDMDIAKRKGSGNTILQEYVLPNFSHIRRGYVKGPDVKPVEGFEEQILKLGNERFSVPEILFHPSDIGIEQMGLPEAIVHSVSLTPKEMHHQFFANIVLTGGNAFFKGYKERMAQEVRKLVPDLFTVCIYLPDNPVTFAWTGASHWRNNKDYNNSMSKVTTEEYKEYGHYLCHERFVTNLTFNQQ